MIECLIVGDSIAVGIHQYRKECSPYSRVGISSKKFNLEYAHRELSAKTVAISLGSNDYGGIDTVRELEALRSRVMADSVYWVLPVNNSTSREAVEVVARRHGDRVLAITEVQPDGIHPTPKEYKRLALETAKSS